MWSLLSVLTLFLVTTVYAAIGPEADLYIINGNVAPDGFTRSYVKSFLIHPLYLSCSFTLERAVLASGTGTDAPMPGVLITADKVNSTITVYQLQRVLNANKG